MPDTQTETTTQAPEASTTASTTATAPEPGSAAAAEAYRAYRDRVQPPAGRTEAAQTTAAATSTTEAETESTETEATVEKPKSSFQERISDLTTKRREAEDQVRELQRQLAEKNAGPAKTEAAPAAAEPAAAAVPKEPKLEDFASYEDYNKALVKHMLASEKAAEAAADQQRKQAETQQAQFREFESRVAAAEKDIPNWREVVGATQATITAPMQAAIFESEQGPRIAFHLAENPAEAARISALHPVAQVRELLKIEAGFVAQPATAETTKEKETPAPRSPASKPPTSVRGSVPAAVTVQDAVRKDDFATFKRLRDQKQFGR